MNDPSHMMNQPPSQMMNQPHMMLNHPQQQRVMPQMAPQSMNQSQMIMNQPQPQMLNRGGYGMWPPAEQLKFQNPMNFPGFVSSSSKPLGRGGGKWKGKKVNIDQRKESYKPPALQELQYQNKMKARRYFPKKKFNNRSAPYAPRNTTSFIIRAKKDGGITSLVSPCPVTPAILPTPIFSPSREALVDTAKEEWGVDGYGSMKGLIRLRSPGNDEEEDDGGSSESDVEEHMEVERRLDHDLSRFEMIYPNYGAEYNNVLENRVDDQDTHIAQVEEENLILKERLFLMEREMADLRRRLISLERLSRVRVVDENNEEVVENDNENESDNDIESDSRGGYSVSVEDNNDEVVVENSEIRSVTAKEVNNKVQEGESVVDSVVKDVKEGSSSEVKDENNTESVVKDDKEGRLTEANEEKIVVEENKESQISEAKEVNNVVKEDTCMEDLEHAADEKDGEENKNESFDKEH